MISVLPIKDAEELSALYNKCNMPLDINSGATVARSGDTVLGACLYTLTEEKIVINLLYPTNDIMLADGILRSALHVADFRGITSAFYSETAPEQLFRTLDFIENEPEKSLKIHKLHESSCKCEKNNK